MSCRELLRLYIKTYLKGMHMGINCAPLRILFLLFVVCCLFFVYLIWGFFVGDIYLFIFVLVFLYASSIGFL